MKSAIVLCSGGLDSVTTAFYVKKRLSHEGVIILFFDYGQRALKKERECAKNCARELGCEFKEITLGELGKLSGSLINKKGKVKRLSRKDLKDTSKEEAKWYVPCRNLIFLSYAFAFADKLGDCDIFVGFKCEGKESFPDTTPKFVKKMNLLCRKGVRIIAPLIKKDKEDIILLGRKLGVDFSKTFSCYAPSGGRHCGVCLACRLRQEGFYWAGVEDGTEYYTR